MTHTHRHTPHYLEIRLINRIQVGFDLLLGQGVSAVDNLFSCPKIHDKRHKTFFRSSASNEICRFANCVIITECIGCINRIVEFFFGCIRLGNIISEEAVQKDLLSHDLH